MTGATYLAGMASLVGDPARASMLGTLLSGRALTAKELACVAGVTPATASGHLGKLVEGRLLAVAKQGRHRYFRLAGPEVARMLEALMVVASAGVPRAAPRATPRVSIALRDARTCYDHLAGRLGVGLADALVARGVVALTEEAGVVTKRGRTWLAEFGMPLEDAAGTHRVFCRPCIDWSERRLHLGGTLGATLCRRCLELDWIRPKRDSRAVNVTSAGRFGFMRTFGLSF